MELSCGCLPRVRGPFRRHRTRSAGPSFAVASGPVSRTLCAMAGRQVGSPAWEGLRREMLDALRHAEILEQPVLSYLSDGSTEERLLLASDLGGDARGVVTSCVLWSQANVGSRRKLLNNSRFSETEAAILGLSTHQVFPLLRKYAVPARLSVAVIHNASHLRCFSKVCFTFGCSWVPSEPSCSGNAVRQNLSTGTV